MVGEERKTLGYVMNHSNYTILDSGHTGSAHKTGLLVDLNHPCGA